jgi:signal transduction histidine kinase
MVSPMSPSQLRRATAWRTAAAVVGVWLVIGLLTTHSSYLAMRRAGLAAQWTSIFTLNAVSVLIWAAFTPAMVWVSRRVPFRRNRIGRALAIHAVACLGFAIADVLLEQLILESLGVPMPNRPDLITIFLRRLFPNALCYIAVVSISLVLDYARASRDRDAREAQLSAQLAAARLQALHAQLRPHFLFNTLSMIAEQVHADPAGADRMIGRLSHLLRVSLSSAGNHEVSLAEEQAALEAYLEIMDVRLSGRARLEVAIPEALSTAMVPTLILQPLAENALQHGIEPLAGDAELLVSASRQGGSLEITIADNGCGFDPRRMAEGVGLRVVRERLAQLYGDAGSLELRARPGGGTVAIVRIPFHTEGVEPPVGDLSGLATAGA